MAIDLNAFGQSTAKGKLELTPNGSIFSAKITAGSNVTLKPGMAVELDSSSSGAMLTVTPVSSGLIFGFIPLVHKNNALGLTSTLTETVEVASKGCVMTMEAGEAIARGDYVKYNSSTTKVEEADTAADAVVGIALDAASATGDLIRVYILAPNAPAVIAS